MARRLLTSLPLMCLLLLLLRLLLLVVLWLLFGVHTTKVSVPLIWRQSAGFSRRRRILTHEVKGNMVRLTAGLRQFTIQTESWALKGWQALDHSAGSNAETLLTSQTSGCQTLMRLCKALPRLTWANVKISRARMSEKTRETRQSCSILH